MIEFKAVSIVPSTITTGGKVIISVTVVEKPSIFKFPLILDKLTGLIFKK